MGSTALAIAKAAATLLSSEKGRKAIGWTLVAILSPVILVIAFLCCLGSGAAEHNIATVDYCFHGGVITGNAPVEYTSHMNIIRSCFGLLDTAIQVANSKMLPGFSLDAEEIKSSFLALCAEKPSLINIARFVGCFFTTERRTRTVIVDDEEGNQTEKEETYTVNIPVSRNTIYSSLSALLGRPITADDQTNIDRIYALACGVGTGGDYDGEFLRGNGADTALDISGFADPATKNAHDLAVYATHAWKSGWGYVWGTYGQTLTRDLLDYKLQQYPEGVGNHETFIRSHWLGGRTTDCVGLIKGYGWLDQDSLSIRYGTNGMPDVGANTMYRNAKVKGPIHTIPETPGLAVWMDGHIGVYIGGGEVIEAMGTRQGVVKTKLAGRGWTHWLEVPYISYGN